MTPLSTSAAKTLAVTGTDGSTALGLGVAGLLALLMGGLLLRRRRSLS
ncbi:LPXTG cell wall anchor domain-containing protein [Microbacterium hydrothermale]